MTGLRESVLKGSGVMNFCASAVMTTRTLQPALVRSEARSAALWAAIEPVTPRTTWGDTLISNRMLRRAHVMKQTKFQSGKLLECASPLALLNRSHPKSARGQAQSKTLRVVFSNTPLARTTLRNFFFVSWCLGG